MRGLAPLAGVLLACASAAPPPVTETYRPTRRDYASFAAAWPDLYDPNYLPFMVHRQPDGPEGDRLFFCRWVSICGNNRDAGGWRVRNRCAVNSV